MLTIRKGQHQIYFPRASKTESYPCVWKRQSCGQDECQNGTQNTGNGDISASNRWIFLFWTARVNWKSAPLYYIYLSSYVPQGPFVMESVKRGYLFNSALNTIILIINSVLTTSFQMDQSCLYYLFTCSPTMFLCFDYNVLCGVPQVLFWMTGYLTIIINR